MYASPTSKRTAELREWVTPTLLVVAALIFLGVCLGARDLWNPNEAIYGRVVVEMAENGEWLVPTLNGAVFSEKPILYYWLARLSHLLAGSLNELTLRLPSLGAGVLGVWFVFLLVRPYLGKRRAVWAGLCLMTLYQVWWATRSIQMDILVMTCTLGTLLPLTRMLDHGLACRRAWSLAGVAVGFGFLAKGPIAVVVPGLVFLTVVAVDRKTWRLWLPGIQWGVLFGVVIAAPWYLALAWTGHTEVLNELLVRQNLSRFVDAWDHVQPWWYYFQYFWSDFFPWAFLIPAAAFLRPETDREQQLHRWAWAWIGSVFVFLSLSDSKRAPYMLPIAPAIAVLASSVLNRLEGRAGRSIATVTARVAMALLALGSIAGGVIAWQQVDRWQDDGFASYIPSAGALLVAMGLVVSVGVVFTNRHPKWASRGLFLGMVVIYLVAAIWILPSINLRKSERFFLTQVNAKIGKDSPLVSFKIPYRHAGYLYYGERRIPNFEHLNDLSKAMCSSQPAAAWLIGEGPGIDDLREGIRPIALVLEQEIGSRRAALVAGETVCASIASTSTVSAPTLPASTVSAQRLVED